MHHHTICTFSLNQFPYYLHEILFAPAREARQRKNQYYLHHHTICTFSSTIFPYNLHTPTICTFARSDICHYLHKILFAPAPAARQPKYRYYLHDFIYFTIWPPDRSLRGGLNSSISLVARVFLTDFTFFFEIWFFS